MSNVLQQITGLVTKAKAALKDQYYNDSYEFRESYLSEPSGLLKEIEAENLVFPIQYTDDGDFYFFSTPADIVVYVTDVMEAEGILSDSDEYEDSESWDDSGC